MQFNQYVRKNGRENHLQFETKNDHKCIRNCNNPCNNLYLKIDRRIEITDGKDGKKKYTKMLEHNVSNPNASEL